MSIINYSICENERSISAWGDNIYYHYLFENNQSL